MGEQYSERPPGPPRRISQCASRLVLFVGVVLFAFSLCAGPQKVVFGETTTPTRLPETESSTVRIVLQDESTREPAESLPAPGEDVAPERFPPLPPDPYATPEDVLPPLEEELWLHGGSYLYAPEGDRLGWPDDCHGHHHLLRLPEVWQEPKPLTCFQEFLGADPIHRWPCHHWPGCGGFAWEPRLVVYGGYELFAIVLEENNQRQDAIGHQMLLDVDFRITGTERFHAQWRPLGRRNTGGSFFQLNDPSFYEDNSTGIPDRYWVEGELYSLLGGVFHDQFVPRDIHMVVGQFPLVLQNTLLINDDILGLAVNKNTILVPPFSNINLQSYYALDNVDAFEGASADLVGLNAFIDYRHAFIEANLAYVAHGHDGSRDATYAAISGTQFFGLLSLAGRALFKIGDEGGTGDGQLFVLESNYSRLTPHDSWLYDLGVESSVFYVNAFRATPGWNSISGGNFNRIRSTFAVNPLVTISASTDPVENYGVAAGWQMFRHHADESLIPEIAIDAPGDETRWGFGLRYLRKTGARTYVEVLGVLNYSDDDSLDREGLFLSHFFLL